MLTITLLGTAATMPLPERALTAAVAECGGHSLLLDCGEGTQVGLRRYGVSAYRLSAVLLTHYHGDHILGLPGLLQTMGSLNRTEPLTIYGPKGIEPVAQAVTALAGPQAYPVRWQVADEPFNIDTLKITPFPLTHRVLCCGYLLALPRAGRFDPARARAAGIPMPYWKTLQRGEPVGGWTPEQQARWHAIVDRCDFETVVQDRYGPGCMQRRNRYMVDHAARLIAVFDGQDGGTRRTVEYALRCGLEVVYVDAE